MQPLLSARQLSLQTTLSDAPLLAKVDPSRIQQVLRDLLANAIKCETRPAPLDELAAVR